MCLSARTLVVIIVTLFVFATADEVTQSESVDFIDEDLCDDVDCPSNEHCEMTVETGPICVSCVVHEQCPTKPKLVCGSDDKTYLNECHMRRSACENGKKLAVKSEGACGALPFDPCLSILCSPGYKCEMEIEDRSEATLTPRCVCSDSDGKCADEEEVEKPCGDHTCKSFEDCIINRENLHVCCLMNCSSPAAIQQFHRPVPLCGSNKIIYSSLCLLDKIRCLTGKTVDVEPIIDDCISHESSHQCGSKDRICSPFQLCARHDSGFSCCPTSCPDLEKKVCGTDGHVYTNTCHMLRHACMSGQEIEKQDMIHCSKSCKLHHRTREAMSGSKYTLHQDSCTECTCNNGEWLCDSSPCMKKLLH
ncbi:follistatin-like [Corticium candelabrum]|uniref:follistatin-like n=1 Tax=Corticium candelabrum TaxID=121492 RepID=UPI002E378B7F|nr:follistatin-like [Corticium candelabrum]